MNRLSTPGYKNLRFEYNMLAEGEDAWGPALSWWFAVAEFLYHHDEGEVPEEWEFRDAPGHYSGFNPEDEGYEDEVIWRLYDEEEITLDDALTFGQVLTRYLGTLKRAGKSY